MHGQRHRRVRPAAGRVRDAGQLLLHRVPGEPRPGPAAWPAHATGDGADHRGAARHDDRRADLPRRRRDGRRPARDDGQLIAQRDIEKVFPADDYSCVGIAGTAGLAIEIVRLFQVELEHYEKIEGTTLSLDGKANRLATMIRGNLGDGHAGPRRRPAVRRLRPRRRRPGDAAGIFSYDVTGGRYEEHELPLGRLRLAVRPRRAEEALRREDLTVADAVRCAVQALYDAADDDSATGGPDLDAPHLPGRRRRDRGRLPTRSPTTRSAPSSTTVVAGRMQTPADRGTAAMTTTPPDPTARTLETAP